MATKVKRSQFATYMDTTPSAAATWSLIGDGITDASVNMNPQTSEEVYIHQDSGSTEVESYKPTMPIEASCMAGDAVWEFIDTLRKDRAVLGDAYTDIVNVWLYETPTAGEYPAELQPVAIQIDTFGGPGGESNKINYTINYRGDPTPGTFNPTTSTFTPS